MKRRYQMMRAVFLIIFATMDLCNYVKAKPAEESQVEVRAVFIKCEADDREGISADNEAIRFERDELFKHSVLQDCNKKITLTVKIVSEPDKYSGDEYVPIEHVFQGPNKRVRLLNPYVLRLRREIPLQAYKLRRMTSVIGVLSNANEELVAVAKKSLSRPKRSESAIDLSANTTKSRKAQACDKLTKNNTNNGNVCLNNRDKRHEHNVVINNASENAMAEDKLYQRWIANEDFIQEQHDENRKNLNNFYETSRNFPSDKDQKLHKSLDGKNSLHTKSDLENNPSNVRRLGSWNSFPNDKNNMKNRNTEPDLFRKDSLRSKSNTDHNDKGRHRNGKPLNFEKEFDMYEIGNPDLLYTIQVQLFEKLTTPEGKTVWNDMTKGESASVNTFSPEWVGQDLNIRYRPTEWVPREVFTLPLTSLCLLTPLSSLHFKDNDNVEVSDAKQYIVVPKEDILGLMNEIDTVQKFEYSSEQNKQCRRRVKIRTSRAIFGSEEEKLNITINEGEQYLTLPHHRPHHAQIDLEARADQNQLVPIGSSGRIMTIVADSSRRTRTVLTILATNTGLAAAKFRAVVRDCTPELMGKQNDNNGEAFSDSSILLPPRHTRNIRLDVPTEMPADVAHCSVSLVNDKDESVAVRDVTIKKGDRCFCVWHCECVCQSEDPKLLCREMAEARQIAAGLSLRERVRHVRSVCYNDVVSINMFVTAFGVLITLLFFGLLKGCLGVIFRCIGSWGLHRIVQMPRKLDHYYERSLQSCEVVYDEEGWPVHPNTKERTVRLVSKPMEFIINVIFFVVTPCIIIYNILKVIYTRCCMKSDDDSSWYPCEKEKSCFSSHDLQGEKVWKRRRRRREIKKWMTPEAEDLSTNIWKAGIPEKFTINSMLPLLRDDFCPGEQAEQQACVDSEGDDTEYVLMQIQKSKESLARSQRKLNGSEK